VTLLPQMAVRVETRAAHVAVSKLRGVQPSRTVGMIWRKTSPLSDQLRQIAEVVRGCGLDLRKRPLEAG